jgi:hypothetical protein
VVHRPASPLRTILHNRRSTDFKLDPALKKGRQTMNQLLASPRHTNLLQALVFCACILGLCLPAAAGQPTIITFDPPGSTYTFATQINPSGTIVGSYLDANNLYHAFRRTPDGTFTIYDAPGAGTGPYEGTAIYSINASGQMAGQFGTAGRVFHAFLLTPQGEFTEFDVPNAGTGFKQGTFLWNINNRGDAAGGYSDAGNVWHGYLRAADGTVTEYDVPGAGTGPFQGTESFSGCVVDCLNSAGTHASVYVDSTNVLHGFIRDRQGDITEFDPPGASNVTITGGINSRGDVVGFYQDANGVYHGFLREKDGRITDVDAPGAGKGSGQGTGVGSIAENGVVTGDYLDANFVSHGFVGDPKGKLTTIDAPGAGTGAGQGTAGAFSSNNPSGAVAGTYIDGNNVQHGFLYIP